MAFEEFIIYDREIIRSKCELGRMKAELADLRSNLKADLETAESRPISDMECELFASSDFVLNNLRQGIAQLNEEMQSHDTRQNVDRNHPGTRERMQREYSERIEDIRNEIRQKSKSEIEGKIKQLQARYAAASLQVQDAEEEVKRLFKEADSFGARSIEIEMMRVDIKSRQKFLDGIFSDLECFRIESNSEPRISLLEEAMVIEVYKY
jgi:hypothetical protein